MKRKLNALSKVQEPQEYQPHGQQEESTPKGESPAVIAPGEPERLVDYDTLKPYVANACPHSLRRWKVPSVKVTARLTLYRVSEVIAYLEGGGAQRALQERKKAA